MSSKGKHLLVATTEDGWVTVYGPMKRRAAQEAAELVFMADSSGNTITEITKPEKFDVSKYAHLFEEEPDGTDN